MENLNGSSKRRVTKNKRELIRFWSGVQAGYFLAAFLGKSILQLMDGSKGADLLHVV